MTVLDDGAFSEVCLVGITPKGSTELQFAAKIEESTPEEGDKGGESKAMSNGGRIWKKNTEDDFEIELKMYEVEIGASESLAQHFNGTSDATEPLESVNSRTRNLFRVAFLWTDDTSVTEAGAATTSGYAARRLVFRNAYITGYKENFDDKILSVTAKFTGPAFTQDGAGNITRQSCTAAGTELAALPSYS